MSTQVLWCLRPLNPKLLEDLDLALGRLLLDLVVHLEATVLIHDGVDDPSLAFPKNVEVRVHGLIETLSPRQASHSDSFGSLSLQVIFTSNKLCTLDP